MIPEGDKETEKQGSTGVWGMTNMQRAVAK